MAEEKVFIIERNKWLTGDGGTAIKTGRFIENSSGVGDSGRFLNDEGESCILGQRCLQLGLSKSKLREGNTPTDVLDLYSESRKGTITDLLVEDGLVKIEVDVYDGEENYYDTELASSAMSLNDSTSITREEREAKLTELFSRHGITLKFVGNYCDAVKKKKNSK